MDVPGLMGRHVDDVAALLSVVAGQDPKVGALGLSLCVWEDNEWNEWTVWAVLHVRGMSVEQKAVVVFGRNKWRSVVNAYLTQPEQSWWELSYILYLIVVLPIVYFVPEEERGIGSERVEWLKN